MSYEIQGKVHKIYDRQQRGEKGFTTRDIALEVVDGKFTEYPALQMVQDKCDIIENQGIKEGDFVKIHFDVRGREWKGRHFTNLNVWKIERLQAAPDAAGAFATPTAHPEAKPDAQAQLETETADLPF
jgi:single-strand DNA-binding protein